MRYLFLFLFFFSGLSLAESIPATAVTLTPVTVFNIGSLKNTDATQLCKSYFTSNVNSLCSAGDTVCFNGVGNVTADFSTMSCRRSSSFFTNFSNWVGCTNSNFDYLSSCNSYSCPTGQGWTLSGSTCTRPDCAAGQVRNSDGSCKKDCSTASDGGKSRGTFVLSGGCGSVCLNGCLYDAAGSCLSMGGKSYLGVATKSNGSTCSAPNPPVVPPEVTSSDPVTPDKCGASGKGFITNSSGVTTCLESTNSNNKTPVTTTDTIKTSDDKKITEKTITTTCSGDGCQQSTTTTSTDKTTGEVTKSTRVSDVPSNKNASDMCTNDPGNPLCKKGEIGDKGKFDNDSRSTELETQKELLTAEWQKIKSETQAMFGSVQSGSGQLPCPTGVTILGKNFQICASKYSDQLSKVGAAVILLAAIGAAFIIFRR